MQRIRTPLMLCLLPLFFLAGCDDGEGKRAAAAKETEKWNSYVELANQGGRLTEKQNFLNYIKVFDLQKPFVKPGPGFTPPVDPYNSKATRDTLIRLHNPVDIADKAAAAAKGSTSELDAAVAAYAPVFKEFWQTLYDTEVYYESKGYIDDDFARGEQLHAKLMKLYKEYEPLSVRFATAMDAKDLEITESDLQAMTKQGLKARPAALRMLVAGRKLQAEIRRQELTKDNLRTLDMAAYRPLYDALAAAHKDLEAAFDDKELLKQENIQAYHARSMLESATNLKSSAAGLIEESQKSEAEARSFRMGFPPSPEGYAQSLGYLIDSYNRLVMGR